MPRSLLLLAHVTWVLFFNHIHGESHIEHNTNSKVATMP